MDAIGLIELIRDISIIIYACAAILSLTILTVIGIALYRKLAPMLESAQKAAENTEAFSSQLGDKIINPILRASAVAYSAGRIVAFALGINKGKGGPTNGQ